SRQMNLRGHAPLHHPGIQLAPLVDVLVLLLIFSLPTGKAARTETELDVKVPKASAAKEKTAPIGDVIVNVKADGNVVVNRRTLSGPELQELLKSMVQLNPEQAVVIRGDETGAYKNIIGVLNICTEAGVTNVAFATATSKSDAAQPVFADWRCCFALRASPSPNRNRKCAGPVRSMSRPLSGRFLRMTQSTESCVP